MNMYLYDSMDVVTFNNSKWAFIFRW